MSDPKKYLKLSIVIPVYNERDTIEELVRRVQAVDVNMGKEIIIVDDHSTDGTTQLLQKWADSCSSSPTFLTHETLDNRSIPSGEVKIFFQNKNEGKGSALRRGFKEAQGEIIIVQDADLEYDPQDYHKLLEPITRGMADVVYGSRFLGGPHRVLLFWHYVGNKFLTLLSNTLTNLNLSDVWTCYKAFKSEVLQKIRLRENGFGFEPEVTAKVARHNFRVYEVPISYWGRTYEEGKKITWRDGVKAIYSIVRYRLFD